MRQHTMYRCALFLFTLWVTLCLPVSAAKKPDPPPLPVPPGFERVVNPSFTIDKPTSWTLYHNGDCDRMNLFLRDTSEPLRQVFFFPRIGPVYMTLEQKFLDLQYENISGQQLARRDMPVVKPFNPENFLRYLPQVLQMKLMREAMPDRPSLHVIEPFAPAPQKSAIDYPDTQTAIIRGIVVQDNRLAEALFVITTVPSPEFRSGDGGGIGMGFLLFGVTAPKGELSSSLPSLLMIAQSLTLQPDYVKSCKKLRAIDSPNLLGENHSLKTYVDQLTTYWEKRTPADDKTAEEKTRQLLGTQ